MPPRAPGAGGPPAAPAYRVAGLIYDTVALAIVEDGTTSHIVEAGDVLSPGVQVVAIDAGRGVVKLMQDGAPIELQLTGGKAR